MTPAPRPCLDLGEDFATLANYYKEKKKEKKDENEKKLIKNSNNNIIYLKIVKSTLAGQPAPIGRPTKIDRMDCIVIVRRQINLFGNKKISSILIVNIFSG